MRTDAAIVTGLVAGIAIGVASAAAYLAVERAEHPRSEAAGPAPISTSAVSTTAPPVAASPAAPIVARAGLPAPSRPTRAGPALPAMPVTPDYGPPPDPPRPIFRCTSRGGTVYSDEPCAGATVVRDAGAVTGYDTRPSDRLARLVAEGRTVDANVPPAVVARSSSPSVRESAECANLRRQVRDLDAAATLPARPETLDEWRRIREDVWTSMTRSRC